MTEKNIDFKTKQNFKELRTLSTGKAIIYCLPNMGLIAILAITVSFTLIFYINIMGQPPIIAGGIYSAGLFVYAIFCNIWGVIADKIGKKKVLLFSGPILAISFIFIWFPPIPTGPYGETFIPLVLWLIVFVFIFRIMMAAFQPILYSLLPELSTDEQNRVKISMINMMMMILGTVIGSIGPIILMGDVTQNLSRDTPKLYYPTSPIGRAIYTQISFFASLVSILFIILFIIMMLIIKEPLKERERNLSFGEIFKDLAIPLKDRNYRTFLITFYLFWIPFIAFQFLLLNFATFVISLRGTEFILMAIVSFSSSIASFIIWKKLSEKFGLKKTLTICLIFACFSFFLFIILLIPMAHEINLAVGIFIIALCFCSLVGTMVFPFALISDLIDTAELKTGKSLSGSYLGAFTMVGSFASASAMLMISVFLELYGTKAPIGYIVILSIIGASLIVAALIIFQKVQIVGTDQRRKQKNL